MEFVTLDTVAVADKDLRTTVCDMANTNTIPHPTQLLTHYLPIHTRTHTHTQTRVYACLARLGCW